MGFDVGVRIMKFEVNNGIIRGLPLAILVTFLVQGSALVWWASAKAKDGVFLEKRVVHLEAGVQSFDKTQGLILQRLARIEERISAQRRLLERIDKRM